MANHPIVLRLLCVALVAALIFPIGRAILPHVASEVGGLPFHAVEAMVSTTLGFGIYTAFFV